MRTILSQLLIPARRLFRDGVLGFPALIAALCLGVAPSVLAQEDAEDHDEEDQPAAVQVDDSVEEVVVTGSRLKRDTYTSVAPLQIITAEVSREAGLVDAAEIVQKSTVSAGQQIDVTFAGYVLDDGPGTATADLRGLGSQRTLLLINGRRVAPAGVEGAPASPDLSLIPGSLVQQYDLLLDGASSVYGSDAVAGVLNVILRKDFDGLEIEAFPRRPIHAGDQDVLSLTWGRNFDRGFVGIGAEYYRTDPVTLADLPWTAGCDQHVEVDEGGTRRHEELFFSAPFDPSTGRGYNMRWDDCRLGSLAARVSVPFAGSIYYTPGYTNGGWPDFSESSDYGFGVDGDGDGEADVSFREHDLNGRQQYANIYGERKSTNVMTYGEYTFEGEMNLTPFFELSYVEDDFTFIDGEPQLFPSVPARNPYNICNPEGIGVDCGLAYDALITDPNYVARFSNRWGDLCAVFGIPLTDCTPYVFRLLVGPIGPAPSIPIVSVRGDRNTAVRYLEQYRYVAGVSGDLPMLSIGGFSDWSFEFAYVHSRSDGRASRPGIRDDRLDLALGVFSTTNTPCANDTEEPLAYDAAPGCVPVNMFARSLYNPVVGDFATKEEREYLFDTRDFLTEYRQSTVSYYMTGSLLDLPAGVVSAGVGVEYREDQITSIPDNVARDGLMFGFFSDGGATGEKYIREAFGEVEIPILANQFAATELTVNLSARWTDDQFHGAAWTGSAKIAWRPIDSLLIRATGGTSYRAPNLRELFLKGLTGFLGVFDPCLVPEDAINPLTGSYDPSLDRRESQVLDNCRANGVDPTTEDNDGFSVYSVEVLARGSLIDSPLERGPKAAKLPEENSESLTAGFAWEQPFTNAFDLTLGANYYQIKIDDTIIEPSSSLIVNNCYYSLTGDSAFCGRIVRAPRVPGGWPWLDLLDIGHISRDNETVRGVDFNVAFDTELTVFDRPIELGVDINAHRTIERTTLFIDHATEDFDSFQREWYFSELRGQANVRLDYDRWRLSWTARYVDGMDTDPAGVDDWSDAFVASDTCLGPPEDLLCRDVGFAGSYMVHSASVWYSADSWLVGAGASNVFDKSPPQVDGTEVFAINNTPIGAGYDLHGRTYFLNASMRLFAGE